MGWRGGHVAGAWTQLVADGHTRCAWRVRRGAQGVQRPGPHLTTLHPTSSHLNIQQVSKIANVKSEISRRHGHAIAVDANYICYGLKGGQIRILNRHTGARTLLKDHAAPVTDLRFFRHDAERCLLASVDTTGQVRGQEAGRRRRKRRSGRRMKSRRRRRSRRRRTGRMGRRRRAGGGLEGGRDRGWGVSGSGVG